MLLERIAGGEQGAKLRAQVATWHRGATREQVEEAFQEACARAYRACRGETEGEVFTWLRTTTHRHLGRMQERARREILIDAPDAVVDETHRSLRSPEEQLIDRENQAEIERMTRAVLMSLSDRQSQIAVLHSHGMRRVQIAAHLGVTERSVKRALERIMAVGRKELVRLAGPGCESGEGLVARFAFGLASTEEANQARVHLASCARCGALYQRLDLLREKVAVLVPIPATTRDHGFVDRWVDAAADVLSGIKRQATDSALQLKQYVSGEYDYPVIDPTALAGVRPGAAAAAVAGCLAIGGGATYCVQQGVDPIAGLGAITAPDRHQKVRSAQRARAPRAPAPPVVAPAVPRATPTPTPAVAQPAAQPTTATSQTPQTPPPAAVEEFDPLGSGGASVEQQPAPSTEPAAAQAGGGSEFGGP
jgi:RNA polymerase sigma factor (sigma-70 family)